MAKSSGKGNWVTINGTHVLIDGNKKIISGPKNLIGMTPRQAIGLDPVDSKSDKPSASKSPASKAMAKAKSDREADPSKKKADGLVERAKRQQASTTSDSIFDSAASTTKKTSKKATSSSHTFEDVVSESYARSTGNYTIKFSDGTSKKMSQKEYEKLYSGKKFEKAIHEKGEALRKLEGKPATEENVTATFDRSIGNTYIGGQTTLKNSFGETVYDISRDRHGFYEATIEHSNGNRSIVYGHSAKELANNINNRQKHYNAPATSTSKTGNPLFDNATNTNKAKSGRGKK